VDLTGLIIQLVSGAVGGNAAGGLFKNLSLGTLGNSIAGIIGGGVGGQLLGPLLGMLGVGGAEAVGGPGPPEVWTWPESSPMSPEAEWAAAY